MIAALRHRTFARLFAAQAASALADFIFVVAIAALLVESGADASRLGLVLAAQALAVVVFALPAGVLSDQVPRRRMMIIADLTRMAGVIAIAIIGADTSLAVLAALTFFVGSGEALFQPAYRSLLPNVLPDDDLQGGNALSSLSQQTALFIGPALAGIAIATTGAVAALALAAAAYGVSSVVLMSVDARIPAAGETSGSLIRDATDGLRALRDRPWIAWVIGTATIHLLVAIAPYEVLLPLIAEDEYGSVAVYGYLLTTVGVGAVIGAVVGSRIRSERPGVIAVLALVPFSALLAALALEVPLAALIAVLLLAGVGEAIFDILWTTGLQRDVPDHLLARVFSLDWLGSLALLPLGLAVTGPAVEEFGRSAVLLFGAGLALATLLPLLFSRSVRRFSSA